MSLGQPNEAGFLNLIETNRPKILKICRAYAWNPSDRDDLYQDGSMARTALAWSIRSNETAGRILEKNGGRNNCSAWIGFAPEHRNEISPNY